MELELNRGLDLNISDAVKNAGTTISNAFNNALEKGVNQLNLENGVISKIKQGFQKFNIKDVASKTIDTAMKSTLKSVAGVKAGTVLHVVANQEREKQHLENPVSHDTDKPIKVAVEAIRLLIKESNDGTDKYK